ncbi:MAG: GtrA family protein [Candidatus Omnitrophica bacterium]|nr:GtrA family protein [Candidatus Omnitrophota bacterium]
MNGIGKEINKYLITGFLAFGMDFIVYFATYQFFGYSISKATSFITACTLAYFLNKYWTFKKVKRSFREVAKFAVLNFSTLGANVAVNKISLVLFPGLVLFAFFVASGTSTVLNFIGQKWWVFRKKPSSSLLYEKN